MNLEFLLRDRNSRHRELMEKPSADHARPVIPQTSLLVCSRNRPKLLSETIQSILQADEIPAEIVIVDQSDAPHPVLASARLDSSCVVQYFWSDTRGVSLARNLAVSAATHPSLVFTDDDMLATPTWFGSLVRSLLAGGPQTIITGRVLSSNEDGFQGYAPSTRADEQMVIYQGRIQRDVLFTNNMAICRSAFKPLGGFDPNLGPGTVFPAAEDNDFAFRWLEAGYRIVYDPDAVIYHRAWRSEQEALWLHWNYGRGQGAFYSKHVKLRDTHMIRRMIRDVIGYVLRFPIRIFRDRDQAYRDMLYVAGLIYGAVQWRIRKRISFS
jgi:GT2 family glycosyltransferase